MKLRKRLILTASMRLVSGVVWGYTGHEALGDGGHIEYLPTVGAAAIVSLHALVKHGRDG